MVYDYNDPLGGSYLLEAATLTPFGKIAKGAKLAAKFARAARGAAQAGERGVSVLGHFPDYLKRAEALGARRFSVPENVWSRMSEAEQWTANQKFLDRAIGRGDVFDLATPLDRVRAGSYLEREIQYLMDQGYRAEGSRLLLP